MALTNAAGTLVERYTYSAYGTLGIYDPAGTVRSSSPYANRYTYTGREWDPDLNLYHFRARWYDPATGGFVTRDPLGYVDGMSLYRGYFGVKDTDAFGLLVAAADDDADWIAEQAYDYAKGDRILIIYTIAWLDDNVYGRRDDLGCSSCPKTRKTYHDVSNRLFEICVERDNLDRWQLAAAVQRQKGLPVPDWAAPIPGQRAGCGIGEQFALFVISVVIGGCGRGGKGGGGTGGGSGGKGGNSGSPKKPDKGEKCKNGMWRVGRCKPRGDVKADCPDSTPFVTAGTRQSAQEASLASLPSGCHGSDGTHYGHCTAYVCEKKRWKLVTSGS